MLSSGRADEEAGVAEVVRVVVVGVVVVGEVARVFLDRLEERSSRVVPWVRLFVLRYITVIGFLLRGGFGTGHLDCMCSSGVTFPKAC